MVNFNSSDLAFGFYCGAFNELCVFDHEQKHDPEGVKVVKERNLSWSIVTFASYFPLVGIIAGIFQRMAKDRPEVQDDDWADFRKLVTIRSWVATIGLGILFLIPDIIFTINRNRESAKQLALRAETP